MAEKFVSPFISGEAVAGDDDLTQLPILADALLFNDSLDEEADPNALMELAADTANFPSESAASEPKANSGSQLPSPGGSGRELNDSLNLEDMDDTQLPTDYVSHTPEVEAGAGFAESASSADKGSGNSCLASPKRTLSKEDEDESGPVAVSKSSSEGKKSTPQEKEEAAAKSAPKTTGNKVKPSFGKKKKAGFNPPKKAAQNDSTTSQKTVSEQWSSGMDQSGSEGSNKHETKSDNAELADSSKDKPQSDKSAESTLSAKTSAGVTEKKAKVSEKKEQKKKEKEEKEREKALKKEEKEKKKLEKEAKKAELERQREEKKLELERKKVEKEQKKMEKELKKAEKEQKKAEKQSTKTGKKKEQTKTTKASNDHHKDDVSGKSGAVPKSKEDNSISPAEEVVEESKESEEKDTDKEQANVEGEPCMEATMDKEEGAAEVEDIHEDKISEEKEAGGANGGGEGKGGSEKQLNEEREREKENIPPNETQISIEDDSVIDDPSEKIPIVVLSLVVDNFKEDSETRTKKKNEKKIKKKFTPPKSMKEVNVKEAKKQKRSGEKKKTQSGGEIKKKQSGAEKSVKMAEHGQPQEEKRKKRKANAGSESEPEAKRSKPANYHGPVWVQCGNESCKKWRLLKDCDDPANVASKWVCSMNSDPDHNSCSAEEERWSDIGDSQEFVESPYIPGSIVWSKMEGYPWWPAMVEEDPNEESYYKMGSGDNPVPVKYHVVFFDTPVSRGWVSSSHTLPFTGSNDPNKDSNINIAQKHRRSFALSKKQANKAVNLSTKERLESFGFAKRFRGSRPDRRKRKYEEDSPEAVPSQWKARRSGGGERKSARLTLSNEDTAVTMSEEPISNHKDIDENTNDSLLIQHHEE